MALNPEQITIYCRTLYGMGIGRNEGKLIEHGEGPVSPFNDGPFVKFLPLGKRKPRILISSGGNPYLLILRGIGYPDPPAPFASRPGSEFASGFSPPGGDAIFDKVFAFDEGEWNSFDSIYIRCFNIFIDDYAEQFIADYRQNSIRLLSPNAKSPFPLPDASAEPRRTELGDDAAIVTTEPVPSFDVTSLQDERKRVLASKVQRPGQAIFREKLMRAYGERCAVTGCNVPAALEAAHIIPYCGPDSDHVSNGLLLRLDLHALFDASLLSFNPDGLKVELGVDLTGGYYEIINGRKLRPPENAASNPDYEALSCTFRENVYVMQPG